MWEDSKVFGKKKTTQPKQFKLALDKTGFIGSCPLSENTGQVEDKFRTQSPTNDSSLPDSVSSSVWSGDYAPLSGYVTGVTLHHAHWFSGLRVRFSVYTRPLGGGKTQAAGSFPLGWEGASVGVGVGVAFPLWGLKGVPLQAPKQEEQLWPGPGTARAAQTTGRSARYKVTVFNGDVVGAARRVYRSIFLGILSFRYSSLVWGGASGRPTWRAEGILLLPGTGSLGGTRICLTPQAPRPAPQSSHPDVCCS